MVWDDKVMDTSKFSKFIKELRLERGLSQEQLAEKLFVHRTTVNKWENEDIIPLNDKLISIANFFDVSIDELLNGKRNERNIDTTPTNNTLVTLIRSKSRSKKVIIFLVGGLLIVLVAFLLYYFVSTYNSVKVYMIYGENDSIRTRDGLLVMNKEKVYFRPGNFYDNKDNLISVDIIRLYYYDDNDNEVILFTGSSHELLMELEQSQETFMNLLSKNKELYLDACYNKSCAKIKMNYFNDFKNNNLMVNNMNDESVIDASLYSSDKSNLINGLIKNGFKYDSEIGYYYLKEDNVEYYYFPSTNIIKLKAIDNGYIISVSLFININHVDISYTKNSEKAKIISIDDCFNVKVKNYDLFISIYNQYLSKYFKGFLEV